MWPDTLPTNDVLTQAVTLRKAFANDDDNGQTYIETIAKSGYRLLVPVQVLEAPEAAVDSGELADLPLPPADAGGRPRSAVRCRPGFAGRGDGSGARHCWQSAY